MLNSLNNLRIFLIATLSNASGRQGRSRRKRGHAATWTPIRAGGDVLVQSQSVLLADPRMH